eukprot:GHVU01035057.1.p1 GENE.GHVU01035057.1~~GHVU01035057.1.p1  ORF type:complete len:115 (-),score=6.84 GHVU01035057.1:419-763(-)
MSMCPSVCVFMYVCMRVCASVCACLQYLSIFKYGFHGIMQAAFLNRTLNITNLKDCPDLQALQPGGGGCDGNAVSSPTQPRVAAYSLESRRVVAEWVSGWVGGRVLWRAYKLTD